MCLVPWLLVSQRARTISSVGIAAVASVGYGAGVAGWVVPVLVNRGASATNAGAILCVVALLGATPWFVVASWGARLLARGPSLWFVVGTRALWGAIDWLRQAPPVGIPWALLGHSQRASLGVAQLAAVGGVAALSALVASCNAAIAVLVARRDRASLAAALFPLTAAASLALFGVPTAAQFRPSMAGDSEILLVQPHVPPPERWQSAFEEGHVRRAIELARNSLDAGSRPTLIVFPETLLTTPIEQATSKLHFFVDFSRDAGVSLLVGAMSEGSPPGVVRNVVLWLEHGRMIDRFEKTHAIPVFEADPISAPARLVAALVGDGVGGLRIAPGVQERGVGPGQRWIAVLCWEALFHSRVAARRQSDSLAIVSLANVAWAVDGVPGEHELTYVAFRAIEQRLPLLHVSLSGPSAAVDALGRVEASLPHGEEGVLRAHIPGAGHRQALPERLSILALALVPGLLAFLVVSRWRSNP